jgi:hypothetical protein
MMAKVSHSNPALDNVLGQHTPTGDWMIRISGYGTFEFKGTEEEAEKMRAHKANWERGSGLKYRVGAWAKESDKLTERIADLFDEGKGAPGELMEKMRRAKKKEAAEPDGTAS